MAEATSSMIKAKFRDQVRSRSDTAMKNVDAGDDLT
jgi:hypothetical protein